jgi:hypothetical protein
MKWNGYPNLSKRPPAPAKGRGPVQRAIRRAFAASGTEALSSSAIMSGHTSAAGWVAASQCRAGERIREALATPGRPGIRVIAERFGVNPSTVQRISRPFDGASVTVA